MKKLKKKKFSFLFRPLISPPTQRDSSGIALFMVLSSVSILSILVTEFTYIAQISQSIAFGGLDHAKAHYLAKSGLKISLLRLKAFQNVNTALKSMEGASQMVSPGMLQKIWSFPFFYPLPTNIPGMTTFDKDAIIKFQKESNLEGSYSSVIESESGKFNLNLLVKNYNNLTGSPVPTPSPTNSPTAGNSNQPNAYPTPTPTPEFNLADIQDNLNQFLANIINKKFIDDPDFASDYRDFRLSDWVDTLTAWIVPNYNRKTSPGNDKVKMKQAPVYSLSELRMLPLLDDDLYNLISPSLTSCPTSGININKITPATLSGIIPNLTDQESKAFFKYRDSDATDHTFKKVDDFYSWVKGNFPRFSNTSAFDSWKSDLEKKGITLMTEENYFKITVQAKVNQSIKTIEAWVTFDSTNTKTPSSNNNDPLNNQNSGVAPGMANLLNPNNINPKYVNSGLKITFMRIF